MTTYRTLALANRDLSIPKAVVAPDLRARTVLTNEPWDYVDLSLVREKETEARFYWQQAREFYAVAEGLPIQSAPLPLYYSFMNAVKALLTAKHIPFSPRHGVGVWKVKAGGVDKLMGATQGLPAGIEIKQYGVLPALVSYYGESEPNSQHRLKDILFNLPFVHRTYCLTYTSQPEMFIPLVKPALVVKDGTKDVYFRAELSKHYTGRRFTKRLPPSLGLDGDLVVGGTFATVASTRKLTDADMAALGTYVKSLREDVYYIHGAQTLWYVKGTAASGTRIQRQSTTLTLAAMHRLSELCRYAPMELAKCLEGQKNWLLTEFIRMSGRQFLDEIASEITGKNFMAPNVRPAN